jgi:hypothetical protein
LYKIQKNIIGSISENECKLFTMTAEKILANESKLFDPNIEYDVFLSHSYKDAKIILGIKRFLEREVLLYKRRLSVYVDWIDDSDLKRGNVTVRTANRLKIRMNNSKCLFFIESEYSPNSKWMPWELGYFDGFKSKVAIFQLTPSDIEKSDNFSGREYLSLYPTVGRICSELYINTNGNEINLINWIN